MRLTLLILAAAVTGALIGLGGTIIELGRRPWGPENSYLLGGGEATGPQARIVVDADEYNFGTMEKDAQLSHTFAVTNTGQLPLELTNGGVSCGRCTEFSIAKTPLQPGESTTVEVKWKGLNGGPFRQSATLNTNDPRRQQINFTINGKVLSTHRISPEELVFSTISVTDSPTADLSIFSYHSTDLAVVDYELSDAPTAGNFEISREPMPDDAVHAEPDAKSGVIVHVKVKPGLPLGAIQQKIRLRLNLPEQPVVEVPVGGTVTSDLQILGRNWDAEKGMLYLGTVKSDEGAKADLLLHARGASRHELKPKVREASPKWLKITIGEPTDLGGGELVRVPITVEIPPGSPAENHMGNQQGKLGEILIDTGHPEAPSLRLQVRFAVGE
jgi:Protein of unknown function (DUF1573)